ncbi:MAG: hypothetical protein F9K31_07640 [Dokdonella sp.]|nr:MAG: hypothetical protein F9K31_07640 [Dokdonella sp.]
MTIPAEMARALGRSVREPALARPSATGKTGRKGRLKFLYSAARSRSRGSSRAIAISRRCVHTTPRPPASPRRHSVPRAPGQAPRPWQRPATRATHPRKDASMYPAARATRPARYCGRGAGYKSTAAGRSGRAVDVERFDVIGPRHGMAVL